MKSCIRSVAACFAWAIGTAGPVDAEVTARSDHAFTIVQRVAITADPETVWDAFTGDVTGWWDHSFSGKPARMFIEPKPGGGFIELFDEAGNGVKHGTVIFAQRPTKLNFEGPLPFNGLAVNMVHSIVFAPRDDGTTEVTVTVNGFGALDPTWPDAVDGVWAHFLGERLKPYVEGTLQP